MAENTVQNRESLFALFPFGNILLEAKKMSDVAIVVFDGNDVQPVPEWGPIPAVVEQLFGYRLTSIDCVSDPCDRFRVSPLSLQKPTIPPQNLLD